MVGAFDMDDDQQPAVPVGLGLIGGVPAVPQQQIVVRAMPGTALETIPDPHDPVAGGDQLTPDEEQELNQCRAGMENLSTAFWVAGKSLETMLRGQLHRASGYSNFAHFVWANWEVSESQAQRLMGAWRIGAALAELGWQPRLSQMEKVLGVAKASGALAAVTVYDAVARKGPVTARALEAVVGQLPALPQDPSRGDVAAAVQDALVVLESGSRKADGSGARGDGAGESAGVGRSSSMPRDVQRLADALARVTDAARGLTRTGVRRASVEHAELAGPLLEALAEQLGLIQTALSGRVQG